MVQGLEVNCMRTMRVISVQDHARVPDALRHFIQGVPGACSAAPAGTDGGWVRCCRIWEWRAAKPHMRKAVPEKIDIKGIVAVTSTLGNVTCRRKGRQRGIRSGSRKQQKHAASQLCGATQLWVMLLGGRKKRCKGGREEVNGRGRDRERGPFPRLSRSRP